MIGVIVISRPKNAEEHRQQLAEIFINLLEEKQLDWKLGLKKFSSMQQHNAVTKTNYKGINVFNLWLVSLVKGYDDTRWVTMNQIMDKQNKYHPNEKWHLQKGSKATFVEYWYPYDKESRKAMTWDGYKQALRDGRNEKDFILKTNYTPVFNASCVDGMPELVFEETNDIKIADVVNKLSKNMGVPIVYKELCTPSYSPTSDKISMPNKELFESEYDFNSTALHELAHATGHKSRLDRDMINMFGSNEYAYEELVAEISSCFMSVNIDIEQNSEHLDNHKAYVQSWIKKLREKPEMLVKAIKDAQECAKYMDYKAELISEQEYLATKNSTSEVSEEQVESNNVKKEEVQETHTDFEETEDCGMGFSM